MSQPNLLFIFTDEQRFDTLACYGNQRIEMPNLNRLASQSVVFDRAYVSQPVCTPSRATLMTGLWPHTHGLTENNLALPAQTRCLPELGAFGDYATGYFGKWHLGDEIFAQHGFTEWRSIDDAYAAYYSAGRDRDARSTYHHWLTSHGLSPRNGQKFSRKEAARLPEELGKPAYLAEEARQFIRQHAGHPWMLMVNFLEPHMPFFGPRDGQYEPQSLPLPENYNDVPAENQPLKLRLFQEYYLRHGHGGMPLQTEADWRRLMANYWGLCSLVDTHVGRILSALEESGQADNTIIVFTSDHGDMMGSHRLLAKCVMFEEAIRVPLLIRLPGQRTGRRIAPAVSHIDLVPTLLELMDQPIAPELQGHSLVPAMMGRATPSGEIFVEWNGRNGGLGADVADQFVPPEWASHFGSPAQLLAAIGDPVRTVLTPDGWKYNWSAGGQHELYNLHSDPCERHNRAGERDLRSLCRGLSDRIHRWREETGDSLPGAKE